MDVKESAFRRAALLLSTIGATYAIVYNGIRWHRVCYAAGRCIDWNLDPC